MTDRHVIAYGLMALMAVAAGVLVWWRGYRSYDQAHARMRARQRRSEAAMSVRRASSTEEQNGQPS